MPGTYVEAFFKVWPNNHVKGCILEELFVLDSSYFLEILGRVKSIFFITANFQSIVRVAQGHPTGSMISRIFTCPMNYSCVVSKLSISYKAVCLPTPLYFSFFHRCIPICCCYRCLRCHYHHHHHQSYIVISIRQEVWTVYNPGNSINWVNILNLKKISKHKKDI